jgi:hypothetical protein
MVESIHQRNSRISVNEKELDMKHRSHIPLRAMAWPKGKKDPNRNCKMPLLPEFATKEPMVRSSEGYLLPSQQETYKSFKNKDT